MPRVVSKGTCHICGGTFAKSGMGRHLTTCLNRNAPVDPIKQGERNAPVFHLVVQGRDLPMYWMHLLVPTALTLADLDRFLRDTWLECCGHLSAFEIGDVRYRPEPYFHLDDEPPLGATPEPFDDPPPLKIIDAQGAVYDLDPQLMRSMIDSLCGFDVPQRLGLPEERSMEIALRDVLTAGQECFYEYDMGTTTELTLKVVDERESVISRREPIRIIAWNDAPDYRCEVCDQPATLVCSECIRAGEGVCCKRHAQQHACGKEMLLPIVNSPRVGMCPYTGNERAWI